MDGVDGPLSKVLSCNQGGLKFESSAPTQIQPPQAPTQTATIVVFTCNPVSGKIETRRSLELAGQLVFPSR